MAQTALIQVRVDDELKREADELFGELGFDTPTAIRIFLKHAIRRQGIPFDVGFPAPNAETLAALEDARLKRNLAGPFRTVDELMASLSEDDDV